MTVKLTDDEFISEWKRFGSPTDLAKAHGMSIRNIYQRRINIEAKFGIKLDSTKNPQWQRERIQVPKIGHRAIQENIRGRVIIGSDLHAWPGERSAAFGAMVALIKELKPSMVIMNGDDLDGSRISRHPALADVKLPTLKEELDAVRERLSEIEGTAPKGCPLVKSMGNHDMRWGMRLASAAPEFAGISGFSYSDHFPAWETCMSIWLNGHTVVKHRWHNGVHASFNNAVKGGKNIVTGHTHRLHYTMFSDYNGVRWGIETGTLSDFGADNDRYAYVEDSPLNWSQGFVVLTFDGKGMLLEPEICRVINGHAYFRGEMVQ